MPHIWTFSPESQSLLQQCLNAASPPDESNKWLQKFGPRNLDLMRKTDDTIIVDASPDPEVISTVQENKEVDISSTLEEFLDPDFDLLSKFGYFVEKCVKTPKLLIKLAETLPKIIVEKLFEHVYDCNELQKDFLENFYGPFLHIYIKRDNSRFCTDVLIKTYLQYPQYLKLTLNLLLKDLEVENNVLHDFILKLNSEDQSKVLNILESIEFTMKEFSHNLFNIYTVYSTCNKSDSVQAYIFSCLIKYSNFCCNDKNYGRLMLAFLKHENSLKRNIFNTNKLEEVIETHKSPFKRPCHAVLKEIKDAS